MDDFISEASIMGQFKHANVIQLKGVVTTSKYHVLSTIWLFSVKWGGLKTAPRVLSIYN